MILRPDAVVLPEGIQTGLEVCFEDGVIAEIRPWSTSVREEAGYVLSPRFVNAHSHFEYYDLIGAIEGAGYWQWITELTQRKAERDPEMVRKVAHKAAALNEHTGVWAVGEWSDWEGSDEAMTSLHLDGCIFQELITFREWLSPAEKADAVRTKAARNANRTFVTPHAPYTVAPNIIRDLASTGLPLSIHAAETKAENDFYQFGVGPIAKGYCAAGIEVEVPGATAIGYLDSLGALHQNTQIVHACAATPEDVELLAERGVSLAHCPRSNSALGCPTAPIGAMLDAGIRVGLGMDSAASSGMIDMFAEMREALLVSKSTERCLSASEVWMMATRADTLPSLPSNHIEVGGAPKAILVKAGPTYESLTSASPRDLRNL
ncbi:MAG: amidohydrolase family protein [Fimbriimonadales bacterium]